MELISKEVVRRIIDSGRTKEQMLGMVESAVTFEECDDCISRQAVIDALEKVADLFPWRVPGNPDAYDSYNGAWNDAIGRAEMEIEVLPAVRPKDDFEEVAEDIDMMEEDIDLACETLEDDEDCISREAAISAAKHIFESNSEMKAFCMMKMLEELPPVKPKERTAHWIYRGERLYTCSACGGSAVIVKTDDLQTEHYVPYLTEWCPKCGAWMIESEEEDAKSDP